ncbi:MAG: hypothetical protein ABSD99_08040 [Candidatus Bathyarchaeia archaeon]|jgi:hypothetical protein
MSGYTAGRPSIKQIVATILLLTLILVEVAANPAYSTGTNTSTVGTSPGKFDLPLGNDFPTFGTVKLSYPDSAILTNSTGDLLFNVTLNPLMLNPTSAQVFSSAFPTLNVLVQGSGFSSKDTTCTLSGIPVASPASCPISGGNLATSFNVANVPPGSYIVTATGDPEGDYSSASFTVLPPSLILNPSSGQAGVTVSVSGVGFYSPESCTLIGIPVSVSSCSITGGVLTGSFTVAGPPVLPGTYCITVTTTGGDTGVATALFTVTSPPTPPQQITLIPSIPPLVPIAQPGTTILVSGSGFSLTDTSCSLSGNPVGVPIVCTIVAGTITPFSFVVANVRPGTYIITATGSTGDRATYNLQVLPAAPSVPVSVPITLDIYIPPDFSGLTISKTWTSFTNNYDPHLIQLSRQSASDQIGPSWWKVSVSLSVTNNPRNVNPENHIFPTDRTQYVRLFQVTSPTTAGRYFFKAFINGISIGAENFPTIVVKASRDPAYISGVLRDSGYRNASRAGQPITLPNGTGARVLATGFDYLGRAVSAQAYLNYTAHGSYTLFGIAPGTYNITAYAAGYLPTVRPWTVSVAAAQSLEGVDIYLTESVLISGTVFSKSPDGNLIPWGTLTGISNTVCQPVVPRAITVDLLDLAGNLVASTSAPYRTTSFTDPTATSFEFGPGLPNPPIQDQLGFDGRIPQDYANYTSGLTWGDYLLQAYVTSYIQVDEVRVHVANSTADTETVLPLIRSGSIRVTVHFRYSSNILVDEPLTTFNSTGGSVPVGGTLTVSAYDQEGILRAQNVTSVPSGSTNATVDLQGFSNTRGFGTFSLFSQNYGLRPGTYYIVARVTSSPVFAGFANIGIRDLYYQTDIVKATIGLSEEETLISFSMYRAGGLLLTLRSINYQIPQVSNSIRGNWGYPGSTIKLLIIDSYGNVYQTNSTQPVNSTSVTFAYDGLLTNTYTVIIQTHGYTQQQIIHVYVRLGSIADVAIYMIRNPVIDLTIFFTHEALLSSIDSTLPFAQPINNLTATPTRIEVFDDQGNFVAANATYIPNNTTNVKRIYTANFTLSGFDLYYGDPRLIWSGFYDTTDGASQTPGGLILYPWNLSPHTYTIRIWVDGYYQLQPLRVTVTAPQNVSVVTFMDRASRIYGTVMGPDYFGAARYLSWATITLQPNNSTLTDIIDVRPGNYTTSSLDGSFQVWVPEGTYGMGVALEGYATYSTMIAVPPGSDMYMQIWLDNYQPSSQLISPVTAIATSSALSLKAHLQRVPKPWVDPS